MKALNKKKYTEAEAVAYISKKYGIAAKDIKLRKENRTRWMFDIQASEEATLELKAWQPFLADFKANNPELSHTEAAKAASPLYKALKEAAEGKVLASSADNQEEEAEEVSETRPANYPELIS